MSVHAGAVVMRRCDERSFTSEMEKPDGVTQFVGLKGIMISIHRNNTIALSLLPKLKSPFVLLPAATPWKKKSGMLCRFPA